MLAFTKYHALGNDYLVLAAPRELSDDEVRRLCDRHRGVGADGVLVPVEAGGTRVHIRNPDGSEAWMSGNGLRIWGRWLVDSGLAPRGRAFEVATPGSRARVTVHDGGRVAVELSPPRFASAEIPVGGPPREVLEEPLELGGESLRISCVSLGNPHCVVRRARADADDARRLGPLLERHPLFPERTNVQLVEVVDRTTLRVEIWERGAGYTLASGSSSCGAVAVAQRLGWCDAAVRVRMPGGEVEVCRADDGGLVLGGPVVRVATGTVDAEALAAGGT